MKSEASRNALFNFRGEFNGDESVQVKRVESPIPSCVSMKSEASRNALFNFRGEFNGDERIQQSPESSFSAEKSSDKLHSAKMSALGTPFQLMKDDEMLTQFQTHLSQDYLECSESLSEDPLVLDKSLSRAQEALKTHLKKKFEHIFEGSAKHGHPTLLNEIYTELYITEGGSWGVNDEHEVRQIETASRRQTTQETPIPSNDIFKPLPGQVKRIRTVLTEGIAGIGKTISVQKFILDWAEGKANQEIDFIFTLPFRDLNLKKDKEFSLIQLLQQFFTQLEEIKSINSDEVKVLFIFDGLDECQFPLDFPGSKICCDVTESSSVDVLLINLIRGNLLPSALLWITSRPAAASQIPPECVHQVTEVRGFNDPQKEEYIRKRIGDQNLASRTISHIKSSRSLYIMCHIPVFCWISATVLETLLSRAESRDLPKTLTEMYTHFLLIQTNVKNQKYHGTSGTNLKKISVSDTEIILKLGKLAFQQLEKGNVIFYGEDLSESGVDVREASVYSGVCTQIFKEECGLDQEKVYSFVHLSIQEYLAALFAFHSCINENRNVFQTEESEPHGLRVQLSELYRTAAKQALKSRNGHLDLFLRFLLGLCLDSNQTVLGGLLRLTKSSLPVSDLKTESKSDSIKKTAQYIKGRIREESSADRTINLFYCLNELHDDSLVVEIQNFLRSGLSDEKLEPHQCSALAFLLLTSEEILDEFDLKTYNTSAAGHQRLVPVVRNCKKAMLNSCALPEKSCEIVASALQSSNSPVTDLDFSYNNLGDSGVKLLFTGLMSAKCKLQKLQLNCCDLTEMSCEIVASALQSSNSPLRDLDLSLNNLGDSGVQLLCNGLMSPNCALHRLGLNSCAITEKSCEIMASALQSSDSPLRDLDLSYNNLGDSAVELLCAGLMSPNCKLERLGLSSCAVTEKSCEIVASALQSSNSPLRDQDLSYNTLGDSGVELLCDGLKSPNCKLQTLGLGWCNLREGCCDVLASVLRSLHSELRDLELRDNEMQDSGVTVLSAGLEDPHCKLQRLGLSGCGVTQRGCESLASALRLNPSHLRELDLRYNHPGDSGVRALSAAELDTLTLLVDHGGRSRTKQGPRKYSWRFSLDPNSAHKGLSLSEGNRTVTHIPGTEEPYPDHPERFKLWPQIVSRESVCDRSYWEAEWSVRKEWGRGSTAVTDKGINRKGAGSEWMFGRNKNSWSLEHDKQSLSVWHNGSQTCLPALPSPNYTAAMCEDLGGRRVCVNRVGVCVDRVTKTLSFYSVSDSDTLTLLHRFRTNFTQHSPLWAGFRVFDSSVSFSQLD
ncbi:hypothetical protein GJAV_G00010020 [Gymnothorax javanicus]|nr:hypothetical protein GJAV_G00010020 [Gymnothorax javanicus]